STKIRLDVMRDHFLFAPTGVCPTEINLQNTGFRVYVANIHTFELTIYNRYGQVVWQTNDPEATWDCRYKGSYVLTGEYIWRAKYTYQDSPNDKQESAGTFFIYL
ncbi:MAG: gliding motility-associated C-terminal domain-containing protein, partial [Bacteroidales bacterium]|nr:gliding motility-associated C-terminal domain-containing protein [Bacteroidales bacterium]